MTTNGTDIFLQTLYKVGERYFDNAEDAVAHSIQEQRMTSADSSIRVIHRYMY